MLLRRRPGKSTSGGWYGRQRSNCGRQGSIPASTASGSSYRRRSTCGNILCSLVFSLVPMEGVKAKRAWIALGRSLTPPHEPRPRTAGVPTRSRAFASGPFRPFPCVPRGERAADEDVRGPVKRTRFRGTIHARKPLGSDLPMNPPSLSGIPLRMKGRVGCLQPAAGAVRTPRPTDFRGNLRTVSLISNGLRIPGSGAQSTPENRWGPDLSTKRAKTMKGS